MLAISRDKHYFTKNGQPFFYLADTCWSAFTNISEADWIYYLDYRKSQGFNVIQVNMLWQWDSSSSLIDSMPYGLNGDGSFNYNKPNQAYFNRAYRMIKAAYDRGLTIALVLLWVNYLPDTWTSHFATSAGIFPKDKVESYVADIVKRYDEFNPIYMISGDTDFPSEEVIDYYELALNQVKRLAPHALTTLHIRGREDNIPERLKQNSNLDFYMYQSGHNVTYPEMPYYLAEKFYQSSPPRPVLNAEPCYEMMGYSGRVYGRWSREDVRRVAWQSVLSGAQAGLTYGATGIYSWHLNQGDFDASLGEAFDTPYDWHDALNFQGAWDYSYVREVFEDFNLHDIRPAQTYLEARSESIRCAENDNYLVVYVPSNTRLQLMGDFSFKKAIYIDLENHRKQAVATLYDADTNQTTIAMHRFTRDALLIIEK